MDKQITRNTEEQAALEALDAALSVVPLDDDRFAIASAIERELLAHGYQIVKISEVKL